MVNLRNLRFSEKSLSQRFLIAILLGVFLSPSVFGAQSKPAAKFADYGKWETLARAGSHGGLSPDGRWIVYAINRSNGDNELRISQLSGGKTEVVDFGSQPVFSSDSRWLACRIGQSDAELERLRKERKPVQNKLGLLNLSTGEISVFESIESFAFSSDGAYLAMKRYGPSRSAGLAASAGRMGGSRGGEAESQETPLGTTLIVRYLESGRDMQFGNVSQYIWQNAEKCHLMALTISAEGKTGNGVHLFNPETAVLQVLDSSDSIYANLIWRKDAADLAVLREKNEDEKEGSTHVILTWTGLGRTWRRYTYDPTTDSAFPEGMRTVSFRPLSWSADGRILFFGIAPWEDLIMPLEEKENSGDTIESEEPSTIEIWHWKDVFVIPWQRIHASSDRRRNMLAAWHIDSGKVIRLGRDIIEEEVVPILHTNLAYVLEWSKYAMERSIGRRGADLYLQDITTGDRTKIQDNLNDRYLRAGPSGKYLLFLDNNQYWTVDLASRTVRNITSSVPASFIDWESDSTMKTYPDLLQKPPFGVAGWTKDDASVLLYDEYDLWEVAADGSKWNRLTSGADERIRHRLVRLDQAGGGSRGSGGRFSEPEQWIDLGKTLFLSLYGEWTKKSGYATLKAGGAFTRIIWLDKNVGSLAKAEGAEVYGYVVQDYDDSPDIYVCGADFKNSEQVTATNIFQEDYAWGRSELIEYVTDKGRRLQGALFYPAGYEPGKTYPMIVYNYELLSQNVHRYVVPSDRSYYNISVFTSYGYLVLEPDIVFRKRQPGWSVVECITAGVNKVIDMGIVDPGRIGIVGHSMGGFNSSFVATHTDGIFAAAVAGAPITDLVSYYGDHHWSSGIAETDHIETGQERMEVALYEDFQAYVDNSAVFNVHNMTVPLLLEVGDNDGTVAWHQSIELYNIARRAKKNVVMLAYMGEDHGLRQKQNQQDYQRRILAWFGHYLKDEPAEDWITEGQSYIERQAEMKRQRLK